ncbi:accessory gene regulator ArgB-like protein [Clostridium sp.]|uniref:accessory gene regulator ArgB-like protein n=1 Tax=Clostridium sp. TaxID=1506 RepID=UPI0026338B07|nr:accessory gene regulator B family protein [Clostridium sp.]
MYNIKEVSEKIACNLKINLNLDEDKYEVISYGLYAFIHMTLSIVFVILFGAIFGVVIESLLISLTAAILRKYSGGAHASKELSCTIIGVIVSIIPAIALENSSINIKNTMLISFLVFVVASYLIYKLAPVDSPNKPIKSEKKIRRLKKGSLITLGIYMILVIINILLSIKLQSTKLLIYSLCISFGVLWQSFTLTKLGHIVLNGMDSFFIKVLGNKGVN